MRSRVVLLLLVLSLCLNVAFLIPRFDWWIIPALVFGWALADFGSGLVHMLMDYVPVPADLEFDKIYFAANRNTPQYSEMRKRIMQRANAFYRIAYEFKVHHPKPDTLGRRSFTTLTTDSVTFGALPMSLTLNSLAMILPLPGYVIASCISLIIGGALAQYLHSCLHRAKPPRGILLARRLRLVMMPSAHQLHHNTLDRDFAIINGWTNPLLNPIFGLLHRVGLVKDHDLEPPRPSATSGAQTAAE